MKKYAFAIVLLLAAVSFAQTSDKVILVSDTTSVDMFIAKAAGEKSGVPVLVMAGGVLGDDIRTELISLGAKTVYLVGGPVVIKPEVETELSAKYTIVRLWGYERTGTAVAVARHFWSEGARCAVVADDTKSSETDTQVQDEASEEAADKGCPFFPVPKGTMPAEVLEVIGDLNTTNATFVGTGPNAEFKSKLAKLILREITGDVKKIERDIEAQRKPDRLLVIAAPNWKYVLGHAGHEGKHTLVRIVNSVQSVPELVTLVNERNLTDVRVLGEPALAGEIAAQFNASGINVTKISGNNAAETAREALKETAEKWEEKRKEAAQQDATMRTKMRTLLGERLTQFEDRLNSIEAELAERDASGEGSADLAARIDAARKQLSAIKEYIDGSNFDAARIRIDKITGELESSRWSGMKGKSNDVEKEEASTEQTRPDIASIEARAASVKERCNSDAVKNLVEKARSLKQEYDGAGDDIKAARLAVEIRSLVAQATSIGNLCDRTEKIDDRIETGAGTRVKNVEIVKARIVASPVAIRPAAADTAP